MNQTKYHMTNLFKAIGGLLRVSKSNILQIKSQQKINSQIRIHINSIKMKTKVFLKRQIHLCYIIHKNLSKILHKLMEITDRSAARYMIEKITFLLILVAAVLMMI